MVQMHPISPSTTAVSFEAEGGIRNPACQDDDGNKPQKDFEEEERFSSTRKIGEAYVDDRRLELQEVMTVCRTRLPWRFSGNVFIALTVTLVMILGELGFIPNQHIGFYCNDPKISFKFTGDTVSVVPLLSATIILPALVIWATEWTCYSPDSYKSLECGSSSRIRLFSQWYGYYTMGWWYMLFIVEVMKVVVGEPRPHFLDSCRPKELVNCTDEYRRMYTCTNTELSWYYVNDSDKSFPSGHSALSMFTAAYVVWYLQARMPNRLVLVLVKPWLQCLAVLWGAGVSLSRIVDNRHHWWDVAAGGSLGILFALFVIRISCRSFRTVQGAAGLPNGPVVAFAGSRHQSVKKLLSNGSSVEAPEGREMRDIPTTWTA